MKQLSKVRANFVGHSGRPSFQPFLAQECRKTDRHPPTLDAPVAGGTQAALPRTREAGPAGKATGKMGEMERPAQWGF